MTDHLKSYTPSGVFPRRSRLTTHESKIEPFGAGYYSHWNARMHDCASRCAGQYPSSANQNRIHTAGCTPGPNKAKVRTNHSTARVLPASGAPHCIWRGHSGLRRYCSSTTPHRTQRRILPSRTRPRRPGVRRNDHSYRKMSLAARSFTPFQL